MSKFTISKTSNGAKNTYKVDGFFSFEDLEELLPLEAATFLADQNSKGGEFVVINGELFCVQRATKPANDVWLFFDCSVRRWHECDDPTKESNP